MHRSLSLASVSIAALLTIAAVACSAPAPLDPQLEGEQVTGGSTRKPSTKTPPKKNTPAPGDEEEGEGGGTGTGTGTGTKTPQQPAPQGGNCSAQTTWGACIDCCVALDPAGIKIADDAFVQCACQNPGTCAAACGNNFCVNPDNATEACDNCLAQATQCQQVSSTACQGNAGCKTVVGCFDTSQCEAKPD